MQGQCYSICAHPFTQANKAAAAQATNAAAEETEKAAPAASGWGDAFLQVCEGCSWVGWGGVGWVGGGWGGVWFWGSNFDSAGTHLENPVQGHG